MTLLLELLDDGFGVTLLLELLDGGFGMTLLLELLELDDGFGLPELLELGLTEELELLELDEQFVPPSQRHKHSLYFAIPWSVPLRCAPQALLQAFPPEPVELLVGIPPAVFAFVLPVW